MKGRRTLSSFPLAVLAAGGLLLTGSFAWLEYHSIKKNQRAEFRHQAVIRVKALEEALSQTNLVLNALTSFLNVTDTVTCSKFSAFTEPLLSDYPQLQAVSWDPLVAGRDRNSFEGRLAHASPSGYQIQERDSAGRLFPARIKAEYLPIACIAPSQGNESAVGFDITSEPIRLEAVGKARASGRTTTSAQIKLVQDEKHLDGFLTLQPVYSTPDSSRPDVKPLRGFTAAVTRTDLLIERSFAIFGDSKMRIVLLDVTDGRAGQVLGRWPNAYAHDKDGELAGGPDSDRSFYRDIPFEGRTWRAVCTFEPAPGLLFEYNRVLEIGFAGLLFTLGITGYLFLLQRRSEEIETLVVDRTVGIKKAMEKLESEVHQRELIQTRMEAQALELRNQKTAAFSLMMDANEAKSKVDAAAASLLESEARFRQLANAGLEGLTIHDHGKIVVVNQAISKMFGYGPDELVGRMASDLTAGESQETVAKNIATGNQEAIEVLGLRKDGTTFYMEARGRPIEYQGRTLRVTTIRDITDRKDTERLQRQSLEALEAANLAKTQFMTTMSHEIRTPLNGIIGVTDLLSMTSLDAKQRKFTETLRYCGENLLVLVNAVLDLSKVESGKMELESFDFDVGPVIDGILEMMREKAEGKGLALGSSMDPGTYRVKGDANRIRQVLVNLVGNAIKFTESGQVGMEVHRLEDSGNFLLLKFVVTDTGIGMEDSVLERIFQPFIQADSSTSRKFGGSGLGLAISKQLVELMGGNLVVESRIGAGSRFGFVLRLAKTGMALTPEPDLGNREPLPKQRLSRSTRPGGLEQASPRILVVEDNPVNREVTTWMLEQNDCLAVIAVNGMDAVEIFQTGSFDLVLMDCQMPIMDGYSAAAAIRKLEGGVGHIPIIATTANAIVGEKEKCLAAGMDDYITKPIENKDLVRIFKKWLDHVKPTSTSPLKEKSETRDEMLFDSTALDAMADGLKPDDLGRISRLIQMFLETTGATLMELRTAAENQAVAEVRRLAHKLKGSCATVGAGALHGLSLQLEDKATGSGWIEILQLIGGMDKKFAETQTYLETMEYKWNKEKPSTDWTEKRI